MAFDACKRGRTPVTSLNYLAYGSNLFPPRLADRITIRGIAGILCLPDTHLAFHKRGADGSGKCTLLPWPERRAYGVVYRINTTDKTTLDRIEGVGHGYRVESLIDTVLGECFFYRGEDTALDASLLPFDWYHAYVVAGAQYHGLPADYVAALGAQPTRFDVDMRRRDENYARLARQP